MTTITGLTADRMLEIEGNSVVDGDVVSGDLILTKHNGGQINAGSVIGPEGPEGPVGSDLEVISAVAVSDVGIINQIRAGRQLALADFTNMGLNAPIGLWPLANSLNDISGNGRHLSNKGTVTFAAGINGSASTAAQFIGSTSQALYIADTGASDPFRIKVGSIGCWFRTAKKGVIEALVSKRLTSTQLSYSLEVASTTNTLASRLSFNGTANDDLLGQTDVCDQRWHFGVVTFDGFLRKVYIDGVIEAVSLEQQVLFASSAPFNIGAYGADGAAAAVSPHYGRISNVFITNEILTDDQIRNLYCAKIPHTLGVIPSRVGLNIRRARKGAALVTGDFPSSPLRLYNFSAGSLGNAGSQGSTGDLTNVGTPVSVGGADGTPGNGIYLDGSSALTSTDTGLPAGTSAHSFGCWMKMINSGGVLMYLITWGTTNTTNDSRLNIQSSGEVAFGSGSDIVNGPILVNGEWHFIVVVHDNSAIDGLKRKLYVDGRCVAVSTVLNSITLGGANKFCIGQSLSAGNKLTGLIDAVFVIGAALTFEDQFKLYNKSSQLLAHSPKNVGDHVEAMSATDLLAIFDTLDSVSQVDLMVAV